YSNTTREIGIGATKQDVRPHLFHELAHSIETNNPKIRAINLAYLKENSFTKQIETLTDYKADVTGYNGKFITPYMG
ncbi:hypothetical protein, partial [Streptococcus pneumoniae]|uniref:hypothetical protein n=1 Tax=Streptococcus pneumoniae TaxID=1313 RepID=UPI001E3B85B0